MLKKINLKMTTKIFIFTQFGPIHFQTVFSRKVLRFTFRLKKNCVIFNVPSSNRVNKRTIKI